jgi:hypothetical protein
VVPVGLQGWGSVALHCSTKDVYFLKRAGWKMRFPITSIPLVLISYREVQMKIWIAAVMFSALAFSPASAAMRRVTISPRPAP